MPRIPSTLGAAAAAAVFAIGAALSQPVYGGGDGSSPEKAVIINAEGEMSGTGSEHDWLRLHYPGWRVKRQALVGSSSGRRYDRLTIVSPNGREKNIYFDITGFFGKM